MGGHEIKTF